MTYIQNHTLLGSLEDYTHVLKDLHVLIQEEESSGLQQQLEQYFERIHRYMTDMIETTKKDLTKSESETFNQYALDTHPLEELEAHLPMPEDSAEWIEWVLHRQQYMAEWCEGIAGQSISSKTSDVFGQIAEHIKEMNRKLAGDTKAYVQESRQISS